MRRGYDRNRRTGCAEEMPAWKWLSSSGSVARFLHNRIGRVNARSTQQSDLFGVLCAPVAVKIPGAPGHLIKSFAGQVARAPAPLFWSHGDHAVVFMTAVVRLLAPAVLPPLLHPSRSEVRGIGP